MSAVIGSLRALLSLDSAAFERGAKRSKAAMGDLERRMVRMGSKMEGVGRRMTLGLTLPMAGTAAVAVKSSLRIIDSQAKMAQSLGTTVKSMQVLSRAADLSGVSIGEVEQATIQLTKRLSQAAAGTGPAVKALDRLHLSAKNLQKLPLDERLATIQDAMADYVPAAERAAVASDLFGSRAGLIFTRIDSSALRIASADVTRFGVAISEVDADQIEVANDAISRLGLVGRGVANQLTVALAPSLQSIADKAASAAEWFSNLSDRTKQITSVTLSLTAALGPVAVGLGLALKLAAPLGRVLLTMVSPIGLVVAGFTALAAAGVYLSNTASDSTKFSAAHELAMDNVTIAMGDQIHATARLADALVRGGPVTLAAIEAKMAEAKASRSVTDELVRARQEKELEILGYYQLLDAIAQYQTQLQNMRTPGDDLEQMPAQIRAAYEETEQALAALLVEQQRLLEGVRSQNQLTDEEQANLQQIQNNIVELQRRWNELNGITAENVTLTERGTAAAGSLAAGLSVAASQALTLSGYLSGLPGALAGSMSNIAGLRAGMAVLAGGGGEMAANVAKYRAQLEASMPPLRGMMYEQRRLAEEGINQQVQQYELEQKLSAEFRNRLSTINKVSSAGGAASKNALGQLLKEINHRKTLLGLSADQRKQYQAVLTVRQRLGKEVGKYSKAEIAALSDQLLSLENSEAALQRLNDLQQQWSENITRTAFEGGSLSDTIEGMLRDIAYQFAHSKIVLPVIASVTRILGIDQLAGGSVPQALAGGGSGGGGGTGIGGNLLSTAIGGSTFVAGVSGGASAALGIGTYAGAGTFAVSANAAMASAVTGASTLATTIGAALPVLAAVVAVAALLKKGLSREYAGTAIRGNLGADGFDGDQFDFHKGGFLRSNRAYHKPLADELEVMLDQTMQGVTSGLTDMAGALGLSADAIEDFTGEEFTLWIHGKDAAQIQKALQEHIAVTSDQMAELILGTDKFTRAGESASATLTRLSGSLSAVNDMADLLGHKAFNTSLRRADQASELVGLFGGAEAMSAAANTYFGAFYSQGERTEVILRRLRERFEEIGVAMPESRDGFRSLVEGIDLTAESGRELYAQMLQLSGAMNEALPVVGQFTLSMTGLLNEIGGEIGTLIDGARVGATDAKAAASLWYRTATTLRDFLGDLVNSDLTAASKSQAGAVNRNRFDTAFERARGGDVDAARDIPDLARNYLRSLRDTATSALDYRRAASHVQGQINFLGGISELEGANDDILTGLYEQQIEVLTGLGSFLQLEGLTSEEVGQLSQGVQDLANDWDGTVGSFQTSLGALEDAINSAEAFSYDDLVGRLDVAVELDDNSPRWLRRLVRRADTGIRTMLDFVIRRDDLTAADRWIATNSLAEHVTSLDFVLGEDLDVDTRRLALRTTGRLRRNLRLNLSQDLDADTRSMVLTRSQTLSRRVNMTLTNRGDNTLSRLNRLRSLIGSNGNGRLTFDGGVQLTADAVFRDLSDTTSNLQRPMTQLHDQLGELRQAVIADRLQREAQAKLLTLQTKGASAVGQMENRMGKAAGTVERFNALRAQHGIELIGQSASVTLRDNGKIKSSFDDYSGTDANLSAFKEALKAEFGTKSIGTVFSDLNSGIGVSDERAEKLRSQIRALGEVPAFAKGGFHTGGARIVGERGWEIEQTGSSRIHSHADSVAMLDNRPLVKSVEALAKQVGVQGQKMEMFVRKISQYLEDWDEVGQPEFRGA